MILATIRWKAVCLYRSCDTWFMRRIAPLLPTPLFHFLLRRMFRRIIRIYGIGQFLGALRRDGWRWSADEQGEKWTSPSGDAVFMIKDLGVKTDGTASVQS